MLAVRVKRRLEGRDSQERRHGNRYDRTVWGGKGNISRFYCASSTDELLACRGSWPTLFGRVRRIPLRHFNNGHTSAVALYEELQVWGINGSFSFVRGYLRLSVSPTLPKGLNELIHNISRPVRSVTVPRDRFSILRTTPRSVRGR